MKLFVFDFDGVVYDSTTECLITSWNAWQSWNLSSEFRTGAEQFTEFERSSFADVRPRVKGAGEYYVVRRCLSEQQQISTKEGYQSFVNSWSKEVEQFKPIFFAMREKLKTQGLQDWINLHVPYKGIIEILKQLFEDNRLAVATLKDGLSVDIILRQDEITLPSELLIDQSVVANKLEALKLLCQRFSLLKDDLVFFDDNVDHLIAPASNGYSVYYATWGGTTDESLKIANNYNIPIVQSVSELRSLVEAKNLEWSGSYV